MLVLLSVMAEFTLQFLVSIFRRLKDRVKNQMGVKINSHIELGLWGMLGSKLGFKEILIVWLKIKWVQRVSLV